MRAPRAVTSFASTTLIVVVGIAALSSHAAGEPLGPAKEAEGLPFLDIRYTTAQKPVESVCRSAAQARDEKTWAAALNSLRAAVPGVRVDEDELFLTPHFIFSTQRMLTSASLESPQEVVRDFVVQYNGLFGVSPAAIDAAVVTREFRTMRTGVTHLTLQQQIGGIDLFGCWVQANVSGQGELINIESTMLPIVGSSNKRSTLTEEDAITAASTQCGVVPACKPKPISAPASQTQPRAHLWNCDSDFRPREPIETRFVYFPVTRTDIRAAWMVTLPMKGVGHTYDCIIDASTGELLRREDRLHWESTQPITMRVFTQDSPTPMMPGLVEVASTQPSQVSRELVTKSAAEMMVYSPNGWINDGGMETLGNNVDAHTDRNSDNIPDTPRPNGGASRVFDFPLDLGIDPSGYQQAAVTQAFFLANDFHDRVFALGFDEAASNFQTVNFSGQGTGGDAVLFDCQEGGFNNANFTGTHADGTSGRVQVYRFNGPTPDRDGDLDAQVVYHELAHGVSIRLVNGLSGQQAGGMGEGWSDFFGLCMTSLDGMDPDASYPEGAYISYQYTSVSNTSNYYFGNRRFPSCTDLSKNPETYGTIATAVFPGTAPRNPFAANIVGEVHNTGEVWCSALWEARRALVRQYGFAGNDMILRLVVDGMKLCPSNPTFVQARAAIIQADLVDFGGANSGVLWTAFAKRGLGVSAASVGTNVSAAVEAFDVPGCPADLDGDGDFGNGGSPDGAVTIDDLLYFLVGFEAGDAVVDLDDGFGTGTRDGAVTIDDLLFFLAHFELGC